MAAANGSDTTAIKINARIFLNIFETVLRRFKALSLLSFILQTPAQDPGPVNTLERDYAAHTAKWVFNVAPVAGDDMDMHMEHGLAAGPADVDADIVAVRFVLLFDQLLALLDQFPAGCVFCRRCLERTFKMPLRDD